MYSNEPWFSSNMILLRGKEGKFLKIFNKEIQFIVTHKKYF